MSSPRANLIWPTLALLAAQSCGVDDRSLSFQVSALGSAPSHGDDAGAPAAAGDGATPQGGQGNVANGGAPTANAGSDSETPGGSDGNAIGGAGSDVGGAPGAGTGNTAGTDANAGSINNGGSGGNPDVEPGNFPCGNLNRNDVDDCAETLVANSRFDASGSSWDNEGTLLQTWKAEDARGGAGSGSLSLINTNVVPGAIGKTGLASHQCLLAWTGDEFELGARVRIAAGQGSGEAGVNLIFFGGDGCEGDVLGGKDVAFTSETGKWVVVRNKLEIPAGTRSARVRLMIAKPFEQASFEAQFDDVLVVKL
jgi:hypothetical protein